MKKDDHIIDNHEFKIPVYSDYIKNKSIWCFAKEDNTDDDVFYIYHDIKDQNRYTRISMNRCKYVYDINMEYLSENDIRWMINILSSNHHEIVGKTVWEYMVELYSFESAMYNGIIISSTKPMPNYNELKERGTIT